MYEAFCEELGWKKDEAKLAQMKVRNQEKLAALDAAMTDAEENLGDIEVRDAFLARADFLCRIGARLMVRWLCLAACAALRVV